MVAKKSPITPEKKKNIAKNGKNAFGDKPIVVGVGASAGGLKALEELFGSMPVDTDLTFVVIQHLDPRHKSILPEILQRTTELKVVPVENKIRIENSTIYVAPPAFDITINKDRLELKKQSTPRGITMPVDFFFRSLEAWNGDKAIGVILSGSGSDGTLGLKEIKKANGMVMVQDPDSAEHDGMPKNALRTGLVDFVLPASKIPGKLIEYVETVILKSEEENKIDIDHLEEDIDEVCRILKNETNHDFSVYKYSTVVRRIEKRMSVNSTFTINDYIKLLKTEKQEIYSLFKELLIGVTSFFRDKEAFKVLEEQVIVKLLELKKNDSLRVWIAGCATGEEAYSLAMLIDKYREKFKSNTNVQIFASDIDDHSLEIARSGRFSPNIVADIPEDLFKKYFRKSEDFFQIASKIREMILFANHSIVKDPPYSRIDLISCRNLLIYMQSNFQEKAKRVFHYALNPKGFLFLGNSESLGDLKKHFEVIDSKWKIFRKDENAFSPRMLWEYHGARVSPHSLKRLNKNEAAASIKEFAEQAIFRKFTNPLLIINKDGEILYSAGQVKKYFEFVDGQPSFKISNAAIEELKIPLTSALRKIRTDPKELVYKNVRIKHDKESEQIKITITPIEKPTSLNNLFMVHIEPVTIIPLPVNESEKRLSDGENREEYIRDIETELKENKLYLQTIIEELQTSNEELELANEESRSANEELQSSNEELETSKEELQSLNEELETSNSELQRKVVALSHANNDINNFLASSQIGTLFLDREMRIKLFTPSLTEIIDLLDSDIDRPIKNFVSRLGYSNLLEDAQQVLKTLVPKEAEVNINDDKYFWMRIVPYRTIEDFIEGVVITFTNITEQKKIQSQTAALQERYKKLFANMTSGIAVQELIYKDGEVVDALMVDANEAYFSHTGIERKKVIGKRISEVFPNFDKKLFRRLVNVVKTGKALSTEQYIPQFDRYFHLSAFPFDKNSYVAVFDNITDKIKAENRILENEKQFSSLFRNINFGLSINQIETSGNRKIARIREVNATFEMVTETSAENLIHKETKDIPPLQESNIVAEIIDSVLADKDYESEFYFHPYKSYYRVTAFGLQPNVFVLSLQDITDSKKEELARQHLAAIVESSGDAIYSISLDAKILTWNLGAEKFYGYSSEEIIGQDVSKLSPGFGLEKHMKIIKKIRARKKIATLEFEQQNKKGDMIPVYLTKSPILDSQGEIVAISDIAKDISVLKKREKQLIKAKKKVEKAGKLKTTFLQNVSHEIRTPMNSILGYTDILKRALKDPGNKGYTLTIEQSGKQLLRLIDDILDISRIESGELVIEKENFRLNEIMYELHEQFEGLKKVSNKNNLRLILSIPESEKDNIIYTDKYRLEQVLSNLLSNAIKYTEKGEVEFGYTLQDKSIRFFVRDTGIGIKKSNQKKIFTRFERAEQNDASIFSGTGLGLSISKGIVEKMGGRIWCESAPKGGSLFSFSIPLEEGRLYQKEKRDQNQEISVPNLGGKKILIAEDDDFSLQMLQIILADTNAELIIAKDGNEALELFNIHHPDFALLDIRLPGMSGYELLEAFRKKNKTIKIIAQTAHAMPEDKIRSINAGFNEHLTKPVSADKLYKVFHELE